MMRPLADAGKSAAFVTQAIDPLESRVTVE
jgi:hypothetical protein